MAHREPRRIFVGAHNGRPTHFGAIHIVRRAVSQAVSITPGLEGKPISPHIFRHSLAMKLLRSGVYLLTMQAWLGHAQVATTPPIRRCGCRDDAPGTRDGGRLRRPSRSIPADDAVLQLLASI